MLNWFFQFICLSNKFIKVVVDVKSHCAWQQNLSTQVHLGEPYFKDISLGKGKRDN